MGLEKPAILILELPLCGRFALKLKTEDLEQQFGIEPQGDFEFESYNIAPSQAVPIIHLDEHQQKSLSLMKWGFLPSWAKNNEDGPRPINARLETAASNALFKGAFQKRRCLIPASGFYEWDKNTNPKR